MRPVGAMTSWGELSLVPLEPGDARQAMDLAAHRGNAFLVDFGSSEQAVAQLLAQLATSPWALPMAILHGEHCVGMATTSLANVKSLNASVLAMFVEPSTAADGFALYLRHVFWNFPLHRVHAQVPLLDLTREYLTLFASVGFVDEGRLTDHAIVAGQPFDAAALGLLRSDFETWCAANAPELVLS